MEQQAMTRETWRQAYGELLQAAERCGLPAEVGRLLAQNLKSEKAMRRMTSYLVNAHPRTMEDVADEMIAIMEDRAHWIQKKQAEESNGVYSTWLNSDRRGEDES